MIDPVLAEMLVCPENHAPVKEASAALVEQVNAAIAGGNAKNLGGDAVTEAVDGLLVREDGLRAYLIRDDIPIMLIDEAIAPDGVGLEHFSVD